MLQCTSERECTYMERTDLSELRIIIFKQIFKILKKHIQNDIKYMKPIFVFFFQTRCFSLNMAGASPTTRNRNHVDQLLLLILILLYMYYWISPPPVHLLLYLLPTLNYRWSRPTLSLPFLVRLSTLFRFLNHLTVPERTEAQVKNNQ